MNGSDGKVIAVEEAVGVLNREKHHGASDWRINGAVKPPMVVSSSVTMRLSGLSYFDALAVAEKYERGDPNWWKVDS